MSSDIKIDRRSEMITRKEFDQIFCTFSERLKSTNAVHRSPISPQFCQLLLNYAEQRRCEFWIATSEETGECLARIGADIPKARPFDGSLGFFDCADTPFGRLAAQKIIELSSTWLQSLGAKNIYAPMDFNSWFNYRFKLKDQDTADSLLTDKSWEPTAPAFHRQLFLNSGFRDELSFASYSFEVSNPSDWQVYLETLRPDYENTTLKYGFRLRSFGSGPELLDDLKKIYVVSNLAFADNPMFEEIPFDIFATMTMGLAKSKDISASRICLSADGDVIGYVVCFKEGDELIYKTVAVHPDYRSLGIANAFSSEVSQYCLSNNIFKTTGALIRNGNVSEKMARGYGQIAKRSAVHRYILMSQVLK